MNKIDVLLARRRGRRMDTKLSYFDTTILMEFQVTGDKHAVFNCTVKSEKIHVKYLVSARFIISNQ